MTNDKNIKLNIYDLHYSNNYFCYFGCGFYHTTLVIGDKEYDYGPAEGIDINDLDQLYHLNLRESILLNKTNKSYEEILDIINNLNDKYNSDTYNPLNNNCHNFIEELYTYVTNDHINISIPVYLSRFKYYCCCFACLFPKNNHILKYLIID